MVKALSIILLLIALAVVFMMQEKTVKTTVVDPQTGDNKVHQVEQGVNDQMEQHMERLRKLEENQRE